jgi:hypothetical protein
MAARCVTKEITPTTIYMLSDQRSAGDTTEPEGRCTMSN